MEKYFLEKKAELLDFKKRGLQSELLAVMAAAEQQAVLQPQLFILNHWFEPCIHAAWLSHYTVPRHTHLSRRDLQRHRSEIKTPAFDLQSKSSQGRVGGGRQTYIWLENKDEGGF